MKYISFYWLMRIMSTTLQNPCACSFLVYLSMCLANTLHLDDTMIDLNSALANFSEILGEKKTTADIQINEVL